MKRRVVLDAGIMFAGLVAVVTTTPIVALADSTTAPDPSVVIVGMPRTALERRHA